MDWFFSGNLQNEKIDFAKIEQIDSWSIYRVI